MDRIAAPGKRDASRPARGRKRLMVRLSLTQQGVVLYRSEMNTVTRAHLAETIYTQVGLSRNESADLLETVLERLATSLAAGQSVKISGFGTFSVRQKGRRVGRNPKTGKEVPILPRRVLVFRPSQVLKARVNGRAMPTDAAEAALDE